MHEYRNAAPIMTRECPTDKESLADRVATQAARITPEEVVRRFTEDGVVRAAPQLKNQLRGVGRDNTITYIGRQALGLGVRTSSDKYRNNRVSVMEFEAVGRLIDFLELVEGSDTIHTHGARSLREKLTLIGDKEYKEAAAGIAISWKAALDSDRQLQIHPVIGRIPKPQAHVDSGAEEQVKSDAYLLDSILSHFGDDDWASYGGRVIVDSANLPETSSENVKVVLLDDWVLSGSQLGSVYSSFISQYPHLKETVEIQLIAANEERIQQGLEVRAGAEYSNVPVKAYFLAHHAADAEYGAYITGASSSADYGFENSIAEMVSSLRAKGLDVDMPPPTNIVRPYRMGGAKYGLPHVERARRASGADASSR